MMMQLSKWKMNQNEAQINLINPIEINSNQNLQI